MPDIPEIVSDHEVIVRGICSPFHVKSNGKVKKQAFHPTPRTDEVSVMRHDYLGPHICKARAQALENPEKNKTYKGLAVLAAAQIRQSGCDVKDSRQIFLGHADIKLGVTTATEPGEPVVAEQSERLDGIAKSLAELANYFPDPSPQALSWTGAMLSPKEFC